MSHHQDLGDAFNFAAHLIALNAKRGTKAAYIDEAETLSYADLAQRIQRTAAALLAAGLRREERVLLCMNDSTDWPVAFLGCLHAGIVPVAINTLLPAEDLAYMIGHSRAQAVLTSGSLAATIQAALTMGAHEVRQVWVSRPTSALTRGECDFAQLREHTDAMSAAAPTHPDAPGFWLYSSGSTGKPKGTLHTHANLMHTAELYGQGVLALRESDVCFSAAKLFFAYGLGNALSFPLSVGATVVLLGSRPTPDAVFERWTRHQVSVFFGAPTGYAGMLAHPGLPTRAQVALRMCSSAGEALPRELGERFKAHFGCDIVDGIGSTEMLHIFLSNVPGDVRYGTTGFPVAGYQVELRGDDGQPVGDGEIGDLYIQGPSSAVMYWNNRAKSRDTFQGVWTKSGDKYVRNADGTYTYSGRSDDMLKVSGQYVSPFEVEATLIEHAAVLEAAVIGVNDDQGLTRVKAFVVCKDGQSVSAEELQAFVKSRLTPFKYPRAIEFVSELPKTATGKIQRFRLRQAQA
jgi:benzoate-CoA ligase